MIFYDILMTVILIAFALFVVFAPLLLVTVAANLILMLFKPITDPIHGIIENVSETIPNPLDEIPMFPTIKRYFGSPKNILFICFVIIFLIYHYLSLGKVDITMENIPLLFPGTALEQFFSSLGDTRVMDISFFTVDPDSYLRIIICSFVTGLFIHIGCTTKDPDAKIHILVQLLYIPLVTLFSSIVIGMIPPDMFTVSFSKISLDFTSTGIVPGDSIALAVLGQLQQWGGIYLKNLWSIIPPVVAFYFLCRSISGFATAVLGVIFAMIMMDPALPVVDYLLQLIFPEGLSDPDAFRTAGLVFCFSLFALGEVIALVLSEMISKAAEGVTEGVAKIVASTKLGKLSKYYNIVTLLISYFIYPALPMSISFIISSLVIEAEIIVKIALFAVALACLLVFSLATFAEYKITKCILKNGNRVSGAAFAAAMVFNVPLWILYSILF